MDMDMDMDLDMDMDMEMAFGRYQGVIWGASGEHLGSIWETSGTPGLSRQCGSIQALKVSSLSANLHI